MIALISDIHGNYPALSAVLERLDSMRIKDIYCLGDVVGYYTQVNECCEELQRRDVKTLMGNHDWYMAAKSHCPRSKSVNDCLAYQKNIIMPHNYDWLCSLPAFMRAGDLFMVHGGWTNPLDEYLDPSEEYFSHVAGEYFASGHTHVQILSNMNGKTYCNPGSVGQPRDNDPRAAFATFDGTNFSLHRVKYDIQKVGTLMEEAGFSGYYYGGLETGSKKLRWATPKRHKFIDNFHNPNNTSKLI